MKNSGPFIKNKNSTNKMMILLIVSLLPLIFFGFIKNGLIPFMSEEKSILVLLKPLIVIIIPVMTSYLVELIYYKTTEKLDIKSTMNRLKESFSIIPGLFIGLFLPINTPIYILIVAALFATTIGKLLFGGFGKNLFNPALIGILFVTSFYSQTFSTIKYTNVLEETVSSATPLGNLYLDTPVYDYSLFNLFLGNYPGSIGETSSLIILISFAFLVYFKVVKWKITLSYLTTFFLLTHLISVISGLGVYHSIYHLLSGGLLFGAVFMATDPVTSPMSPIGQVLYGMTLGLLTLVFRFLTPYPEGVMTSILIMNLFIPIYDKIGSIGRIDFKKAQTAFLILLFISLGTSIYVSTTLNSEEADSNFSIISKEEENKQTIYVVTQRGFAGDIKGKITIENDSVSSVEILENSESYYHLIEESNFLNELAEDNDADSVSGATITSTAIKKMIQNVMEDYE